MGEEGQPLRLRAILGLAIRLGNNLYRVPFIVAKYLAVDVLIGTSFIHKHVRNIAVSDQRVDFRKEAALQSSMPAAAESKKR